MVFSYNGVLIPVQKDTREMLRDLKRDRTYDDVISDLIAIADLQGYTSSKRADD
jgi:uncharacterized protein (UPF0297 family)